MRPTDLHPAAHPRLPLASRTTPCPLASCPPSGSAPFASASTSPSPKCLRFSRGSPEPSSLPPSPTGDSHPRPHGFSSASENEMRPFPSLVRTWAPHADPGAGAYSASLLDRDRLSMTVLRFSVIFILSSGSWLAFVGSGAVEHPELNMNPRLLRKPAGFGC